MPVQEAKLVRTENGLAPEYVDIVRKALRRETVAYEGHHYTLPLPDGPVPGNMLLAGGSSSESQ